MRGQKPTAPPIPEQACTGERVDLSVTSEGIARGVEDGNATWSVKALSGKTVFVIASLAYPDKISASIADHGHEHQFGLPLPD
jgi:hypothetical protein